VINAVIAGPDPHLHFT